MREEIKKAIILILISLSALSVYLSLKFRPVPQLNLSVIPTNGSAELRIVNFNGEEARIELVVVYSSDGERFFIKLPGSEIKPGGSLVVDLGIPSGKIKWVSVITSEGDCFSISLGNL